MRPPFPAHIWVWLAAVGIASFLTWGALGSMAFPFGGFSVSVNAWTGNLLLPGVQLPNWLTVVAAVGAVGVAYARNMGTDLSPRLAPGLLLYALVHVALFGFFLLVSGPGTLGIGTILMFVALFGLRRALVNASRNSVLPSAVE